MLMTLKTSLVCECCEAEVVNANVVPDLRDEDVGDQNEKFDDVFRDYFYESDSEYVASEVNSKC